MAITLELQYLDASFTDGTSDSSDSAEISWFAFADNGENEIAVHAHAVANLPAFYNNLVLSSIDIDRLNDRTFRVSPSYKSAADPKTRKKLAVDETRWSITSSGSETVTQTYSEELISETVAPGFAEYEFTGTPVEKVMGITNTAEGLEVEGVEVPTGAIELSVETVKSDDQITGGYLVALAEAVARQHTNSVAYNGFPIGTLRLIDYQANDRGGDTPDRDINVSISYSPNLTNLDVGGGLIVPKKNGHDIVDVMYVREAVNGLPLSKPIRAAVHRVHDGIDFAAVLGI